MSHVIVTKKKSMSLYRFDGSYHMGAAIVPQLNLLGGQARPL